jgi:hypothetical protein
MDDLFDLGSVDLYSANDLNTVSILFYLIWYLKLGPPYQNMLLRRGDYGNIKNRRNICL